MTRSTVCRSARWGLCIGTLLSAAPALHAQLLVELGNGSVTNGPNNYPAPYGNEQPGARHQLLIPAGELQAAGMGEGTITSVAFHVETAAGVTLQSFRISMGTTATNDLNQAWEQGLTTVFGPAPFIDQQGWNTHLLDVPYDWDGISNLVLETCFSNGFNSINAQFFQTATTYTSTIFRATTNPNVCTSNGGNIQSVQLRPDLRFEWTPPPFPPVAAFSGSVNTTCTGTIAFTDASTNYPDSWAWDFGDGTTDTVQDPVHTWTADGDYTVTLIATNAFGSDTVSAGPFTVSVNAPQPAPACTPQTQGSIAGFGILGVSVNASTYPSSDASVEGYLDRTCVRDTVEVGSLMDLAVSTGTATTHNVRAWCDWDNNGTFTGNEDLLSANSVTSASGTVLVPAFALLNTPLRLRVIADYDFSAPPTPCLDPQFGQAEDYTLVVIENPLPPAAAFSTSPVFTCNGVVQFTDESQNLPTGWTWDFGDGTGSTDASPVHTYTGSGTYDVELIVTNANGGDTLLQAALITVDLNGQLTAPACIPQTQSYCCDYGILAVSFGGISTTSVDGSEGYVDRSCGNTATVEEGTSYPISITTGGTLPQDVFVWLDLDNDAAFSTGELIWSALNTTNPSGSVLIPNATIFNTAVRLRVTADVIGEIAGPCDQPLFGQAEDYSVIITPNNDPPVAAFTASPTQTCDGIVQFTDLSTDLPTGWSWDFGDGNTSTDPDPLHTYALPGIFTVTLTVTNANGSDASTQSALITYYANNVCDTTIMPGFQDELITDCNGTLTDDGGASADYTPGMSGAVTIAPPGAEVVTLTFTEFAFETDFDYLNIYDGPDNNAPLLYAITGNGVGAVPNGGVITSSGPAITIQQDASPGPTTWEGFICSWECSFTGVSENGPGPVLNVYPQPAGNEVTIALDGVLRNDLAIELHDALGRTAVGVRPSAGSGSITLDVSGLSGGLYTLTAITAEGRWSRTLVIE